MMTPSTIRVCNVWMEDLFQWFFDNVFGAGGDGSAAIVCKNYEQAAEYFLHWYGMTYEKDFYLPPEKTENSVNFTDNSNENYIFTNDENVKLFPGDYIFIVESECYSSKSKRDEGIALFPAKLNV
jgi:hypothetical protein